MQGNREQGDLHDHYEVERNGFKPPKELKQYMLILFAFSIVFFFIQYQRVYGSASKP
jgi:hypothetical protein